MATTRTETSIATNGKEQKHLYADGEYGGAVVNHIRNLGFELITSFSHGHHVRSGKGADVFNFTNLGNVRNTVVGRFEDFDPTQDKIQINGVDLDFNNLPSNVRIVSYNGDHNDPGALPQQWLLIDTGAGHIFYALEGARVDMTGDGGATGNDGNQESHFLDSVPNFSSLPDVRYQNPFNFVPAGYTPDGGEVIHDYYVGENPDHNWGDRDPSDLAAYVEGTAGGDLIASGLNDDLVRGNGGNDLIWGGDGNDLVYGQTGNDTLYGNAGNDTLNGGAGSDRLIGGAGRDVLWGGNDASRDTFVFSALIHSKVGAQRDVIQDFQHGVDVIELTTLDSNVSVAGNQNFLFGGATAIANGVWYGSANGGVIVRGDINGDKVADFEIFVANVTSVTATDFLL